MDHPRSTVEQIMRDYPDLSDFGFEVFDARGKTPKQRASELAKNRTKMLKPRSLEQFQLARRWLRQFTKVGKSSKLGTSDNLKHLAERDIGYVTNGMFIAAAIAEGFKIEREWDSPNPRFNISSKAFQYLL